MFLKLNWIGLHVSDFNAALRFYTEILGMNATDIKPDWAYFATTGMTFELFGSVAPLSSQSTWGQGQPIRPGIQVADLHETVTELRQRGVEFTSQFKQTAYGEMIEFTATENMRWALAHTPTQTFDSNLNKPHIGWLEIKTDRFAEQQEFYSKVLGLQPESGTNEQAILRQGPREPILCLVSGGQQAAPFQIQENMPKPMPSHLMSVETDNIKEAAAWLKSKNIPTITEITRKSWGGIDFYITDSDGNLIQIVQYVQPT